MKNKAYAIMLALVMTSAAGAEQGKPKDNKEKGKPQTTREQPSAQAPTGGQCSPDTTAPVIAAVTATPNSLGPPNHKMTPVAISARVTDNCSAATWSVTGISSNEPVNGTGDGDTEPDWSIAGAHGVSLRAERAGSGSGRTYTITITARDVAGNTSTGTTTVAVPHNR